MTYSAVLKIDTTIERCNEEFDVKVTGRVYRPSGMLSMGDFAEAERNVTIESAIDSFGRDFEASLSEGERRVISTLLVEESLEDEEAKWIESHWVDRE